MGIREDIFTFLCKPSCPILPCTAPPTREINDHLKAESVGTYRLSEKGMEGKESNSLDLEVPSENYV